jgi:1-acyl-sn-glycerol-3-phosphate acyltransferase
MRSFLRLAAAALCFAIFGIGSLIFGWVLLPLAGLSFDAKTRLRRRRAMVHLVISRFVPLMARLGFTGYRWDPMPAAVTRGGPFVLIANHPTLIDTLIVLSRFPEMSSVAKPFYIRSPITGPMLRSIGFFAPMGEAEGEEVEAGATVARMVELLREGRSLVIFPEGTRSPEGRLLRFRRGAVEAAIRAQVPIVPLFIGPDQPLMRRGHPWHDFPAQRVNFALEFFPVIETAGAELDAREVNRELYQRFQERFARLLASRQAALGGGAGDRSVALRSAEGSATEPHAPRHGP